MALNYNRDAIMKRAAERNTEEIKQNIEAMTEDKDPLLTLYGGAEERLKREREAASTEGSVVKLSLGVLKQNANNHFSELEGEKFNEFVASIKAHGILNPIIVRPIGSGFYQILAGHNRVRGAEAAGLTEIPAIVKNVDDLEASIIIADTNLQREEVTDLEKGWAYRTIYEAIKKQGARTDLTSGQRDHKLDEDENLTSGQRDHKLTAAKTIAEKYNIGEKTVRRKIRLTYLTHPLYTVYEKKAFSQETAEYLSYLKEMEQAIVAQIADSGVKIEPDAAKELKLRSAAEIGDESMTGDEIMLILTGGKESKLKIEEEKPKVEKYKVSDELFPVSLKKKNREAYIVKALEYIRDNGINLEGEE